MLAAPRGPTTKTNLSGLESLALEQGGYFDRRDARAHGLTDQHLQHHVAKGRFERVYPGVYRLAIAPLSPFDDYFRAWVWTNYRGAISHESALALFGLSDVMPLHVHVTVPRPFDRASVGFRVHRGPLPEQEVQLYDGIRVTSPARSIVDAAATGTDPVQVGKAVREALGRALLTPDMLRAASHQRSNQHRHPVGPLIERAIADATR